MADMAIWAELTSPELARLAGERCVAVLPVGAVEQHGPHLPLGTDAVIAEGLARAALERLEGDVTALLLPTQAIGESCEHEGFAGTLGQRVETLLAAWCEIGAGLARNGIFKLAIVNGHGGQAQIVDLAAKRLRVRHAMVAVRANYLAWPLPAGLVDEHEQSHGHHGGLVETALMLALKPEQVRLEALRNFPSAATGLARHARRFGRDGRLGFAWRAGDLNPQGVVGNAAAATAEIGRALLECHARRLAELIADAADFDRKAAFAIDRWSASEAAANSTESHSGGG